MLEICIEIFYSPFDIDNNEWRWTHYLYRDENYPEEILKEIEIDEINHQDLVDFENVDSGFYKCNYGVEYLYTNNSWLRSSFLTIKLETYSYSEPILKRGIKPLY